MKTPPMLLILVFFVELLFIIFIFVSLLSHAWISVDSDEDEDTTSTYGIFKACFITEQSTRIHNRDVKTHCSRCWDTGDSDFVGDISESSLTAAQAFSVISMIAALLLLIGVVAHTVFIVLEFDNFQLPSLIATVGCGILLWIVYTLACIFATTFFRQLDYVWISSNTQQEVEALDFGYGKVMTWFTWAFSFIPTGGLACYTFKVMRNENSEKNEIITEPGSPEKAE